MNSKYTRVTHPFPIILDEDSRILILGSFPSVKSREKDFYYMHPQNRFWKILSKLFDIDFLNMSNDDKRSTLNKLHIALYDTVYSCDIINSSDVSIKNVVPLDLDDIMSKSKIKYIFCNGSKSYSLFLKYFEKYKDICYRLPSSSPANAIKSLDDLVEEWKIIKEAIIK